MEEMYLNVHIHMYIGFSISISKLFFSRNIFWILFICLNSKILLDFFLPPAPTIFPYLHCGVNCFLVCLFCFFFGLFFVYSHLCISFIFLLSFSPHPIYFPNIFLPHSTISFIHHHPFPHSSTFILHKLLTLVISTLPTYHTHISFGDPCSRFLLP